MKAYVGVTDGDWYRFLAQRPEIGEVNFWRPSGGRGFAAIASGEFFLFKTHHPHNRIVGGGVFNGFVPLRLSEAWEFYAVPQRLGQQAFQALVLRAYQRRCAVTGGHIRPVLQAAHIRPLPAGGEHRIDNGLLLRSDGHTLFDRGYLGVDPRYRLVVSPQLRSEFGNGDEFYSRSGETVTLPERRVERPNREFLEWHLDEVFRAS